MYEQLKEKLKEIVEICEQCPEQYRGKCFEILLEHYLSSVEKIPVKKPSEVLPGDEELPKGLPDSIFHTDGDKIEIIVKDLKTKSKADKQVRLALLLGMRHQKEQGSIPRKELRELCKKYAALDGANFSGIMKKRMDLFVQQKNKDWQLTKPGENEAVQIIKELAGVDEQNKL